MQRSSKLMSETRNKTKVQNVAFKGCVLSLVNRSHMHPSEIRFWPDLKLCSWSLQREQAEEGSISFYNPLDQSSLSELPQE